MRHNVSCRNELAIALPGMLHILPMPDRWSGLGRMARKAYHLHKFLLGTAHTKPHRLL